MAKHFTVSRRDFLRTSAIGTAGLAMGAHSPMVAPSDRITIGMIGSGARAHRLVEVLQQFPEVEVVAACDAYKGRLERMKSRTGGRADTMADYREIINRDEIDAVVISSPDHWHYQHSVDSLNAGKHAYIEKPLTYSIEEGNGIVEAQRRNNLVVQVGSSGPNSVLVQKARQMIREGKLGQVTMIRSTTNRNTASGAWIYPIPPDASPNTVDWDLFLGSAPKIPYSPERFFRWRCYKDYSGGLSTDLYVHTCTTINYLMGAGIPESVIAMGDLYRWTRSRDVPDTINASLKYSGGFMVNLSGTFNNQEGNSGGMRILGTEGSLVFGGGLRFIPERVNEGNRWITNSWPEALEDAYLVDPAVRQEEMPSTRTPATVAGEEVYHAEGKDSLTVHVQEWLDAIRKGTPTKQDAEVGHRAAACAHMINASMEMETMVHWRNGQSLITK
ncbi:MAG: Gfo/Idh/MocA family oxidoreductase [Bacteroidetes bacterium]|nr:Gfo/Idh/MocA family oxidoreductase [Bacteroidota bacterium]MCY4205719.1 Gfo/Idh/MocA family oxidoreductase [Bacteroidota bacterium]